MLIWSRLRTPLVVEDEMLLRMMLGEVLREAGFFVMEACNADDAMTILFAKMPDLIITDVRMPGSCDGIGFLAKVREMDLTLPVIITSAHLVHITDPSNGRTQFVSKPYCYDALTKLVESKLRIGS